MRKSAMLAALLMLLSGFSALAADIERKLGDFGLTTVSQIVQFETANGNLWKNKGVQVYHPNGRGRYAKTEARMRRLPVGAIIKISDSLVKTTTIQLPAAQSAKDVCAELSTPLWMCQQRLENFNPGLANSATWKIPAGVPFVLVLKQPPAAPVAAPITTETLPTSNWRNFQLWFWLFIIALLVIVALLLVNLDQRHKLERWERTAPPNDPRRRRGFTNTIRRLKVTRRTRASTSPSGTRVEEEVEVHAEPPPASTSPLGGIREPPP